MRIPAAILVLTALTCVAWSDRPAAVHHERDRPAPERPALGPLGSPAAASMTTHAARSRRLGDRHSGPWNRLVSTDIAGDSRKPHRDGEPAAPPTRLTRLGALVRDVPPGTWFELPNSSIRAVLAARSEAPNDGGVSGSRSVIDAWNGAAFDGRCMYFHGGGHRGYSGNEVYRYCLDGLRWERLTDPSPLREETAEKPCPDTADGTPLATQTYDGIVWVPATRTIHRFGGVDYCRSGMRYFDALWEFDPGPRVWTRHDPGPLDHFIAKTVLDPVTGHVILAGKRLILRYDPLARTYTQLSGRTMWIGDGNAELDPNGRRMVILQRKQVLAFNIDTDSGLPARPVVVVPTERVPPDLQGAGLAYGTTRKVFVLWHGGRETYTLNPETWEFRRHGNAQGPAPTAGRWARVYSKWQYVPEHDVFVGYNNIDQGVWVYRLPDDAGEPVVPDIRSCSPAADCTEYVVLQYAIDASRPGYTVTLAPHSYRQCAVVKVDNLTIVGTGAHLRGRACAGKAALVIKGRGVTVDGLECSEITVPDRNGACIRVEAPDLTVRGVRFHDNENGVLGGRGGTVTIEDSLFERNGHGGRAHGVYLSRNVDLFVFRNNRVLSTKGEGHGLKSRARRSVIEGNVIAGLQGRDSRAIDLPNGGNNVIRDNVLEKGRNSSNYDLIGIALESSQGLHQENITVIQGNTMLCDLGRRCRLVHSAGQGSVELRDNVIVGPTFERRDERNRWYSSRAAAGLPETYWQGR